METNNVSGQGTYPQLKGSFFAAGSIPQEGNNSVNSSAKYCYDDETTPASAPPAAATSWLLTAACPSGYSAILTTDDTSPTVNATSWTICALLENGTSDTTQKIYCKSSRL